MSVLPVRSTYHKKRSVMHDNKMISKTVVVRLMCFLNTVLYRILICDTLT